MSTKQELLDKIEKVKTNKSIPEHLKPRMLQKYQDDLDKLEKSGGSAATKETKPAAAKKPAKKAKAPKAKKPKSTGSPHLYKGKPVSEWDCAALEKDMRERIASREKSGKKSKTKSVIEKITSHVVHAAKSAIAAVPVAKIEKNPAAYGDKMEQIEQATKDYFKSIRAIMGDLYDADDVNDEMKDLRDFVKKRYDKYVKD